MKIKDALIRRGVWGMIAGVVIGLLPLLPVLFAGGIATLLHCQVDESGTAPCMIEGVDIGGTLSLLGLLGWLIFFSAPLGVLVSGVSAVVVSAGLIRFLIRRKRAAAMADTETQASQKAAQAG